jgi:cell division protein FtsN
MSSCIQKMSGKGETTELFLRALSDVRGGDPAAARAQLTGLAEQTGNPDVALKALWILYQASRSSGDSAEQAALRAKMAGRFAAAPETALTGGPSVPGPAPRATVIQMPAPGPFDAGTGQTRPAQQTQQSAPLQPVQQPVQSPPVVPDGTPTARPGVPSSPTMSVQAGSFVMKENADDLVSELTRRGFAPVVIHDSTQGKDRYRVMVGTGLAVDAAKGILKKLSDAGFRGFLMQDK